MALGCAGEPGALTARAQSGTSLRQRSQNMTEAGPQQRRRSVPVDVGGVLVGGGAPVVVQSMTNTDTADVEETARQVAALAAAGSEIVAITGDRNEAAGRGARINERRLQRGGGVATGGA